MSFFKLRTCSCWRVEVSVCVCVYVCTYVCTYVNMKKRTHVICKAIFANNSQHQIEQTRIILYVNTLKMKIRMFLCLTHLMSSAVFSSSFSSNSLCLQSYASSSSCSAIICSSLSTSLCVSAIIMSRCLSSSCLYRSTWAFSSSKVLVQ